MLENRSYDNVLGWLYNPSNQPPYDQAPQGQINLKGLTGNETNPPTQQGGAPIQVMNQTKTTDGKTGAIYPGTTVPIYDPGEPFADMAQQIIGSTSVPSENPYNIEPWPPDSKSLMQGFTLNYAQLKGAVRYRESACCQLPGRDELPHAETGAGDSVAGLQLRGLRPVVCLCSYAHSNQQGVCPLRDLRRPQGTRRQ